jgi:pimeloyl-ACP methyl ester carboxylesterase
MSTYVLIHGGSDGGFVWEDVATLLRERGHGVHAPDLPAHGEDETPIREASLGSYAERVCEVLDAPDGPVILVGHSSGGIAITQAAEHRPQKIEALVYLAAYLPQNGQSMLELVESDPEARGDDVVVDEGEGWLEFPERVAREAFGTDVADAVWDRYWARTRPEPLAPLVTPVLTTEKNFGRVPRVYVETLRDRAVTPAMQLRMRSALPCRVVTLDSGHMPMLSTPRQLAEILASLASREKALVR